MKYLILTALLFSQSSFAKIHDSFMCYTHIDTVVLFGILKPQGTLRINYWKFDNNPETIDLKISRYTRTDYSINAVGEYQGKPVINVNSVGGVGTANIDLTPFSGTEDTSFENEEVLCYFGKFEE